MCSYSEGSPVQSFAEVCAESESIMGALMVYELTCAWLQDAVCMATCWHLNRDMAFGQDDPQQGRAHSYIKPQCRTTLQDKSGKTANDKVVGNVST